MEIEEGRRNIKEKIRWNEDEIEEGEVRRAIRKLKRRKAAGQDKITDEAWIEGGVTVLRRLTKVINVVWKEGKLPEEWKE